MAVIGRSYAILDSRVAKLHGFLAWLAWASIHLLFLPAAGNRIRVWHQWIWSYVTHQKSSQLIVEPKAPASVEAEPHLEVYENARRVS